jgi:tetraacyldisaccharide 4'-kinase
MRFVERLQARWYSDRPPPWWTRPLAALYGFVARRRSARGAHTAVRLPVPVVVVGNITVGGTGKTPLTIALVAALTARGWTPGVVSRGYGGRMHGPGLLPANPDPAAYGDEPALMHASGVTVAIGRDRVAAARLLIDAGCDLVLADDGLQHARLARDIEICVIDGARRFGNGRLLPAGPLREPVGRLATVDFRINHGGVPHDGEVAMHLDGDRAYALLDRTRSMHLDAWRGVRVHAVAGIGNPQRFFDALRERGIAIVAHAFPDHHRFTADDFAFAGGEPVLMTSKDAVKCRAFAGPHWFELPVRAEVDQRLYDEIHLRLVARPDAGDGR